MRCYSSEESLSGISLVLCSLCVRRNTALLAMSRSHVRVQLSRSSRFPLPFSLSLPRLRQPSAMVQILIIGGAFTSEACFDTMRDPLHSHTGAVSPVALLQSVSPAPTITPLTCSN